MKRLFLTLCLVLLTASTASAEGFQLMDWGARGLSLANGMIGRADDASAVAYNAAGITQLPGTHFMLGATTVTPQCNMKGSFADGSSHTTEIKISTWLLPHFHVTHQLTDTIWLGLGVMSRFGTGVSMSEDWFGRYGMYDVGLQTLSFVPTVAYKINDHVSVSLGVEAMYAHLFLGNKVPGLQSILADSFQGDDIDFQQEGDGWGFGVHAGLHIRFNEQWAMGIAYKSQVTMTLHGNGEFSRQAPTFYENTDLSGTVQLPDSLAVGLAWKPRKDLSFEVGGQWTRWSTYNALNIYYDKPTVGGSDRKINNKEFRDGWNFNASVEYWPTDWWALRAGFLFETPVVNESHADTIVPNYGREELTLGMGFKWENWTLDLAYAHLWNHPTCYDSTDNASFYDAYGLTHIKGGHTSKAQSDSFSLSLGYSF